MADWGDVTIYDEMIAELGLFCGALQNGCEQMMTDVQTCVTVMESDVASLKACKNVVLSVKKYEEAQSLASQLAAKLSEEREDLVNYLKSLEDIDNA